MTNNEIFKKILFLSELNYDIDLVIEIFKLEGVAVSKSKVRAWRGDIRNDPRSGLMPDTMLYAFFNGLFKLKEIAKEKDLSFFDCSCIL